MSPKSARPRTKPAKASHPPKPWDVPPPPAVGDSDIDTTFKAVGLALTNWEHLERQLGAVFAILLGLNDSTEAPLRAYGSVITFRGRAEMLKAAAEAHFLRYPMEKTATRFKSILDQATQLGARRNEIAHGSVEDYRQIDKAQPLNTYVLIPGLYSTNKRVIEVGSGGPIRYRSKPKYVYSSVEINAFAKTFKNYASGISMLWGELAQAHLKRLRTS